MIYEFRDIATGVVEEHSMRMAELDQFKLDNPHLKQVILSAPVTNYTAVGHGTMSDQAAKKNKGWGEVLSKISEQNPNSVLASQFHKNKSINRIKAETIVDKHATAQRKAREKRAEPKSYKF